MIDPQCSHSNQSTPIVCLPARSFSCTSPRRCSAARSGRPTSSSGTWAAFPCAACGWRPRTLTSSPLALRPKWPPPLRPPPAAQQGSLTTCPTRPAASHRPHWRPRHWPRPRTSARWRPWWRSPSQAARCSPGSRPDCLSGSEDQIRRESTKSTSSSIMKPKTKETESSECFVDSPFHLESCLGSVLVHV